MAGGDEDGNFENMDDIFCDMSPGSRKRVEEAIVDGNALGVI